MSNESEIGRAIPKIIFIIAAEILALSVFLPWSGDEPLIMLLFTKDVQLVVKVLGIFTIALVYFSSLAFFTLEPNLTIIGLFTAGMGMILYTPIAIHQGISFGFELAIFLFAVLLYIHFTHITKPIEAEIYTLSKQTYNLIKSIGFIGILLTFIFMYVGLKIAQSPNGEYMRPIFGSLSTNAYYIILGIVLVLLINTFLIAIVANRKYSYYASMGLFFAATLTLFTHVSFGIFVFRYMSIGMVIFSSFLMGITKSVPFPPKDYIPSFFHY